MQRTLRGLLGWFGGILVFVFLAVAGAIVIFKDIAPDKVVAPWLNHVSAWALGVTLFLWGISWGCKLVRIYRNDVVK